MLIINYFFPALLSLQIVTKDKKLSYIEYLTTYALYVVGINLMNLLITYLLFPVKRGEFVNDLSISYTMKYLLLSVVLSVTLPYLFKVLSTNIKIKITSLRNENEKDN